MSAATAALTGRLDGVEEDDSPDRTTTSTTMATAQMPPASAARPGQVEGKNRRRPEGSCDGGEATVGHHPARVVVEKHNPREGRGVGRGNLTGLKAERMRY